MKEMNIILEQKDFLKRYHYICGYKHETNFWGGIRKEEIRKYSSKCGSDFNIIIYDSSGTSMFYSIPFKELQDYLNENEGFLSHQAKEGRWQFTIKNDILNIHGTKYRIDVSRFKNNIMNIPQLQLQTDFETLSEIYSKDSEMISYTEGKEKVIISTKIERDRNLRNEALKIFGYNCAICNFNFEETYGEWGRYFAEVHHLQPLSELGGREKEINPKRDLVVLCANCHRMIHRKQGITLTVDELRLKLRSQNNR